jgi:hypothetical protein
VPEVSAIIADSCRLRGETDALYAESRRTTRPHASDGLAIRRCLGFLPQRFK